MQPVMRGVRMHGSASLELSVSKVLPKRMRAATRELTHLHTPDADRGKGLASLLMQKVCREADQYRMFLLLTAGEGLERFYLKFGFEVVQEHPITIMARAPLKPEAQVITLV